MKRLLIVAEGKGEMVAAAKLVSRLLRDRGHDSWIVPEDAYKLGGLPVFLSRPDDTLNLIRRKNPDAVLFLSDLDRGCPKDDAPTAAEIFRSARLPFPTAVVLAQCEYEAWVIASIETVAASDSRLPGDLTCEVEPESIRDAKGWLTSHLPDGVSYKPTLDQARYTSAIDVARVFERSRSFRRLCHALDQLATGRPGDVTPG